MIDKFCFKLLCVIVSCLFSNTVTSNVIVTAPPQGIPSNNSFSVRVRDESKKWQELFNYNVRVNFYNVSNASMVKFSFSGTIDMEVKYNVDKVNSYEIRPAWMVSKVSWTDNIITLSTSQVDSFPRNFVIIVNDDLDHCLHVLTNPLEVNPPKETDSNVCVVEPGQTTIPLPEGKNTYYFKPGLHTGEHLGTWIELDLGKIYPVDSIALIQRNYAHRFKVYIRNSLTDNTYTLAYNGMDNTTDGIVTQSFAPVSGRYVKVQFFENTSYDNLYSTHINEFKIFAGASQNLALNKLRVSSNPGMEAIVDGNDNDGWKPRNNGMTGDGVAGRFWLYGNGQKMYIPDGAVVRGGIYATGVSDISIFGRGIVDASQSLHAGEEQYIRRVNPYLNLTGGARDTLEGITVLDPPGWTAAVRSPNSLVKNYSSIGCEGNSDGISLGRDITLTGVFIRTSDDVLCYPGNNTVCKNSVVWGDKAHVFFLTSGKNIRYSNIDVIGAHEKLWDYQGVICIQAFNGKSISDITFEDIRISPFRDPQNALVMWITTNLTNFWWPKPGESIKNVVLKNITYEGSGETPSIIEGSCSGIQIVNYKRPHFDCVTSAHEANIVIKGNTDNITFSCSDKSTIHIHGQKENSFNNTIPIVSISTSDSIVRKHDKNGGVFTINRTGVTTLPLTVNYQVNGTATRADFISSLSGSVIIPSGSDSVNIPITPIDNNRIVGTKKVTLSLKSNSEYAVGSFWSASLLITD